MSDSIPSSSTHQPFDHDNNNGSAQAGHPDNNEMASAADGPTPDLVVASRSGSLKPRKSTPKQQEKDLICTKCATRSTPLWRRDDHGHTICNACGLQLQKRRQQQQQQHSTGSPLVGPQGSSSTASDLASITGWAPQHNDSASGSRTQQYPAHNRDAAPLGEGEAVQILAHAMSSSRRSPPALQASANAAKVDDQHGSCPGNGVCNGLGGKECCQGCPAFNNRVMYAGSPEAQDDTPMVDVQNQDGGNQPSDVSVMECFNCHTRTTPLWRRDGEGRVCCNACGLFYKLHGEHRQATQRKSTIKRRKRVPAAPAAQNRLAMDQAAARAAGEPIDDPVINVGEASHLPNNADRVAPKRRRIQSQGRSRQSGPSGAAPFQGPTLPDLAAASALQAVIDDPNNASIGNLRTAYDKFAVQMETLRRQVSDGDSMLAQMRETLERLGSSSSHMGDEARSDGTQRDLNEYLSGLPDQDAVKLPSRQSRQYANENSSNAFSWAATPVPAAPNVRTQTNGTSDGSQDQKGAQASAHIANKTNE